MKKILVAAFIVGLGVSGLSVPFSGSWEMDITLDPRVPVTGLSTILMIDYTIRERGCQISTFDTATAKRPES